MKKGTVVKILENPFGVDLMGINLRGKVGRVVELESRPTLGVCLAQVEIEGETYLIGLEKLKEKK